MKLSIIIPVFNEEKTILQTLRKVEKVEINGVKKEIIIIDDGSTDIVLKFMKNFKEKTKELKLLNKRMLVLPMPEIKV